MFPSSSGVEGANGEMRILRSFRAGASGGRIKTARMETNRSGRIWGRNVLQRRTDDFYSYCTNTKTKESYGLSRLVCSRRLFRGKNENFHIKCKQSEALRFSYWSQFHFFPPALLRTKAPSTLVVVPSGRQQRLSDVLEMCVRLLATNADQHTRRKSQKKRSQRRF